MSKNEICQKFANDYKLIFEDRGEVGFSRPCVGFIKGNSYLDISPFIYPNFDNLIDDDLVLWPPHDVKDAYHKHDCLCVLVHDNNYDEGIRQLILWVKDIESKTVEVIKYLTGATGMQAMVSGSYGYVIKKVEND